MDILLVSIILIFVLVMITQRKQARERERDIRWKSQTLDALLNTSSIGIILMNKQRKLLDMSVKVEEMLGFSLTEINNGEASLWAEFRNDIKEFEQKYLELKQVYKIDRTMSNKSGELLWGRISISLVEETMETPLYYLIIIEDLTKMKQLELTQLQTATELRLLQAQINPHFLFNTLTAIYSLIRIKQDDARELTLLLANYMRANLASTTKPLIKLAEEIDLVETYLHIIKYRFSDQFQIKIVNEAKEVCLDTSIPPFTLQPLIENCIRHGLKKKSKEGLVVVTIRKQGDYVCISVEDNGLGLSEEMRKIYGLEKCSSDTENGMTVYNINQRLKLLVGEEANLRTNVSELGGLNVSFCLPVTKRKVSKL